MKTKTVEFDYEDKYVHAVVYLGTTTGRGDDHDDVISLHIEDTPYPSRDLRERLEEMAIEIARYG